MGHRQVPPLKTTNSAFYLGSPLYFQYPSISTRFTAFGAW